MKTRLAAYLATATALFVAMSVGSSTVQLAGYVLTAGLSSAAVVVGIRMHRPRHRTPWVLLAVAMGAFATVGVMTWLELNYWTGLDWLFMPVDIALLAGYGVMIAAFWSVARRVSLTRDPGALLDMALLVVGASVVVYELILHPIFDAYRAQPVQQLRLMVYPLLDFLLVVLVIRILLSPGRRPRSLLVLVAALGFAVVTDLVVAGVSASHPDADLSFATIGGVISLIMLGASALMPSMAEFDRREHDASPTLGRLRSVAIGTALALPALTAFAASPRGAVQASMLLVPSVVMIVLVVTRVRLLFGSLSRTSREIERRQEYFKSLVHNITDIVLVTDAAGSVLDRTASASVVLGTGTERASLYEHVVTDDYVGMVVLQEDAALDAGRAVTGEARLLGTDGAVRHYEVVVRDLSATEAVGGVVWVLHDVSEQKAFESKLRHQALHDALTGLPNRFLFTDRLAHARARREKRDVAVLFVDLDDFKSVNDTLGHDAGDQLLCEVADRLRQAVRDEDTVARLGGDEFAVLVEGDASTDGLRAVAERVVAALREPFLVADRRLPVTASVGGAVVGPDDEDDVLALADTAMYRAKAEGKNGWALFEHGTEREGAALLHLDADLCRALDHGELHVDYRPLVTVDGDRVVALEAVPRWNHPTEGLLTADAFLPTAERNGLAASIGRFVLRNACERAASWSYEQGALVTTAVTVSPRHLVGGTLVTDVRAALEASGLPAEQLVLQIEESALQRDLDGSMRQLAEIRQIGVRLAVDGAGYAWTASIGTLPVDVVRMEASFRRHTSPSVVRALVDLGHALGVETVVVDRDAVPALSA